MRIFHTTAIAAAFALLQVTSLVQTSVTAQLQVPMAEAASTSSHALALDFATTTPVAVRSTTASFDQAVATPLRAAQAARAAAEAQAKQAIRAQRIAQAAAATPIRIATGDIWERLRLCEAGGDYAKNNGNGYYGAYQYDLSTWANYGGYARPDLAPPAVQDAKAQDTQSRRGWSPWPACARKLGLL